MASRPGRVLPSSGSMQSCKGPIRCHTSSQRPEVLRSVATGALSKGSKARGDLRSGDKASSRVARTDIGVDTDEQVPQFLAPEPDVSPPGLSPAEQEELERLLEENGKLRQKVERYMDRLKPNQLSKLMSLYEDIAATGSALEAAATAEAPSMPQTSAKPVEKQSVGPAQSVVQPVKPGKPVATPVPSTSFASYTSQPTVAAEPATADLSPEDVTKALESLSAAYLEVTQRPAKDAKESKKSVSASPVTREEVKPKLQASAPEQVFYVKDGDEQVKVAAKESGEILFAFAPLLKKIMGKENNKVTRSKTETKTETVWTGRTPVVAASYVDAKETEIKTTSAERVVDSASYANEMATLSVELDEVVGEGVDSSQYAQDMATLSVELDEASADTEEEAALSDLGHDTDNSMTVLTAEEAVSLPTPPKQSFPKAAAALKADVDDDDEDVRVKPTDSEKQAAQDVKVDLRKKATQDVVLHDPSAFLAEKGHWLVATVPEKPVAGAECVVYFNRQQSDALRHRPAIQMQLGFNQWELQTDQAKLDLAPAPVPRSEMSDFWWCKFQVPEQTFEINFVMTDGQGNFDNNNGQDFTYFVDAGITLDEWIDMAADRAAAELAARKAAEAKAAEEAERERQAAMLQQDAEKGRQLANDLRNSRGWLQEGGSASQSLPGDAARKVWTVEPAQPHAFGRIQLRYNLKASPIGWLQVPEGQVLNLKYGFNNWKWPGSLEMKRVPGQEPGSPDDWWEAEFEAPFMACAVNFVINYNEHYDNNNRSDYKILLDLPPGMDLDRWIEECAEKFRQQEYESRTTAEAADRERQARRAIKKKAAQDLVKAVERRKVRHVLYTEPEVVKAGQEVTVYYNPNNTNLGGRQQLYLLGGWNRWTHRRPFGPLPMTAPEEGGVHWKATVKVPKDAYKMDFVFSDVAGGDGTYDNRGGLDYHLPVEGSPVNEPSLYVCHISVEMAPIAKVGGLGDVVTALGRAVKEQGHWVEVILPKFSFLNASPILANNMRYETEFEWGGTRIYVTSAIVENLRVFFIEPRNGFFDTGSVYGRYDDEIRFDFFCKAALEFLLRTNRQPDILHCHDWSTAYVAKSYWADYNPFGLWKPKVVFTIHNLNYGQKKIAEAAYNCQKFTTVSPTYAYEVGGTAPVAPNVHKFMGIRNGIDMELWDPETNMWLPQPYNADSVVEGKRAARQRLRQQLGLTDWGDKFIVGVVSRLTGQKGVHLIKHTAWRTLERGGQFVLLGSAPDPKVQADFNALAASMGGQGAAFCFKYDEPLSHLIYAACDMIVVPSMFEPCGLTQMIAMRYGAVPVVRHTGGLKDTVFDVDFDKARAAWEMYGSSDWQRDSLDATNGFAFEGTDNGALDYALNRAIDAWYNDKAWFQSLQKRVMEQDWSWNRPAIDYIELYYSALKN